jgi:N-acetylglutamate synthase
MQARLEQERATLETTMPEEAITRDFQITDYADALELWRGAEGIEIAEGDLREEVAGFLSRNPGLSRVAEAGNVMVGVALCGQDGRRGYIYHLAVQSAYQKFGLARRLVGECLDRLRQLGLRRALILVAEDNPGGQAFWQRCGWEEVTGAKVMGIDL